MSVKSYSTNSSNIDDDLSDDCNNDFECFLDKYSLVNKIKDYRDETVKIITYSLNWLDFLSHNFSSVRLEKYTKIFLCIFNVTTSLHLPFIGYYLQKNDKGNQTQLEFPYIFAENMADIYKTIHKFFHNFKSEFVDIERYIKGYFEFGSHIYLFIDMTEQKSKRLLSLHYDLVFVDELLNSREKYDITIAEDVSTFFLMNPIFTRIHNPDNKEYETPIILYDDYHNNEGEFCLAFDKMRSTKKNMFGSAYYFTTYRGALKKIYGNKSIKTQIGRAVVFLGKQKVLMNYPNDEIDRSVYKRDLLIYDNNNENNINNDRYRKERLTTRISDYDSLWTNGYDSVYIGKIKLDDDSYLHSQPLFVVKSAKQFKIIDLMLQEMDD